MTFSLEELDAALRDVHDVLSPTPQLRWPLLEARLGTEVWLKHENHLPTGAFKVRGGVVMTKELAAAGVTSVVAATRGNHGQSVAFSARRLGLEATVVVPRGNSAAKNRAMTAFGARLVEHGHDFQAALEHAHALVSEEGLTFFPSFAPQLVKGVASYGLELFRNAPPLDVVYVAVGLGSGLCGVLAARDALGLATEVVGVVSERAPAYKLSYEAGHAVATETAETMADGLACRVPNEAALALMRGRVARFVAVSDDEVRAAMRALFDDTHQVAEGAGAIGLAAALQDRPVLAGKRVGLVLSGGNVDRDVFAAALA